MNNKPVTLLTPNGQGEVTVQPNRVKERLAKGFKIKPEPEKKGKDK